MKLALGILALALLAGTAKADQVWNYQSNPLNGTGINPGISCNCEISGTVDFTVLPAMNPDALIVPAASWSFTDGTHTLTNMNSIAEFSPYGYGQSSIPFALGAYDVFIQGNGVHFSISAYDIAEATDSIFVNNIGWGYEEGNQGIWSDPVATPEPSTFILLVAGLGAVALSRKKRVDTSVWEPLA